MINFDHMTATARTGQSRSAMLVRQDGRSNGFAYPGIGQRCGRSFVPGGAD
jgi:hypothetical protein